jgi:hypothetical protein
MSSHVVSIRHELSLSVLRVIALSRITYKAMMQNLVLATACHSPYGWSLRALGNYSPDGHRCPRRGGEHLLRPHGHAEADRGDAGQAQKAA